MLASMPVCQIASLLFALILVGIFVMVMIETLLEEAKIIRPSNKDPLDDAMRKYRPSYLIDIPSDITLIPIDQLRPQAPSLINMVTPSQSKQAKSTLGENKNDQHCNTRSIHTRDH